MTFSLFDLNEYIRRVLALNFREPLWITAEIASCKSSRGHFYLDLVQNGEQDIVAQASAALWSNRYRQLRLEHGFSLDEILREGLEVRLLVRVDFHERYGLKLQIEDVDTAYTFGRLALQRRQTIDTLRAEQLLEANKLRKPGLALQRIAVVSSEDAAGWQDFREQLAQNAFGYRFHCQLFPSAMQGQRVELELPQALERIALRLDEFDAVAIIRGGGARLDLAAFDQLAVARAIAGMPLPVFTGIGHDIDETVADMVAFAALKTPTAVADYLIQHQLFFENSLLTSADAFRQRARQIQQSQALDLERLQHSLSWHTQRLLQRQTEQLDLVSEQIPLAARQILQHALNNLAHAENICLAYHPAGVLRRGFAVIRKDGKALRKVADAGPGDRISAQMHDGLLHAKVE